MKTFFKKYTKLTTILGSIFSWFLARKRICSALLSLKRKSFNRHLDSISMETVRISPKWDRIIILF